MKRYIGAHIFTGGKLIPEDKESFDAYKKQLSEADRLRLTLEPYSEKRSEKAFRLFHELRDRYSTECNVDKEAAKIAFKLAHGVVVPIQHNFACEREGQVVELPSGKFVFLVSTNAYTVEEMNRLVKGTIAECLDAQVDIDDLIQEWRS